MVFEFHMDINNMLECNTPIQAHFFICKLISFQKSKKN